VPPLYKCVPCDTERQFMLTSVPALHKHTSDFKRELQAKVRNVNFSYIKSNKILVQFNSASRLHDILLRLSTLYSISNFSKM
jgi:hypothetical protein